MFSFGICFLEMITGIKNKRQSNYSELRYIVDKNVDNGRYRRLLLRLLNSNRQKRPTSRELLIELYKMEPGVWERVNVKYDNIKLDKEQRDRIYTFMKYTSDRFKINRGKKSYGSVVIYLSKHDIHKRYHILYSSVILMIFSSVFGGKGLEIKDIYELCKNKYGYDDIYRILKEILSDINYVNILLSP